MTLKYYLMNENTPCDIFHSNKQMLLKSQPNDSKKKTPQDMQPLQPIKNINQKQCLKMENICRFRGAKLQHFFLTASKSEKKYCIL